MPDSSDIGVSVADLARRAKAASRLVAQAPSGARSAVLLRAAAALRGPEGDALVAANAHDVAAACANGLDGRVLDRLRLDRERVDALAERIEHVAALPDPLAETGEQRKLPGGPYVARMRVPLGLVAFMHEACARFTAEAAALGIKSGNAVLLRGGVESHHGDRILAAVFARALLAEGLPEESASLLPGGEREAARALLGLRGLIDLVVARGGASLGRFVAEHARVPVIGLGPGVCHLYVDADADVSVAERVLLHAKAQRPQAPNAVSTLLVDEAIAPVFLMLAAPALEKKGIVFHADARARDFLPEARPLLAADLDTPREGLDLGVVIVDGLDGALAHVTRHGTHHTEVVITQDRARAERFVREVDAGMVLVNASSRYHDGAQLGLGAELGIATTKLHAYGAFGLVDLCALKWVAYGDVQVRP